MRAGESGAETPSDSRTAPTAGGALHSPLPWHVASGVWDGIEAADGTGIAMWNGVEAITPTSADEAFIVRCVNSHQALVNALKDAAACLDRYADVSTDDEGVAVANAAMSMQAEIDRVLALVEGGH